jgi:hypothetical protein
LELVKANTSKMMMASAGPLTKLEQATVSTSAQKSLTYLLMMNLKCVSLALTTPCGLIPVRAPTSKTMTVSAGQPTKLVQAMALPSAKSSMDLLPIWPLGLNHQLFLAGTITRKLKNIVKTMESATTLMAPLKNTSEASGLIGLTKMIPSKVLRNGDGVLAGADQNSITKSGKLMILMLAGTLVKLNTVTLFSPLT